MNSNENILNYVSKCVNWDKTISSSDTSFWLWCQIWHLGMLSLLAIFLLKTLISKTVSLRYVFDKVPSAKWPHKPGENIVFLSNLQFTLYLTIKTSIFKLRPLFRLFCPINSIYRRCVSCIYNIYPIDPIYPVQ